MPFFEYSDSSDEGSDDDIDLDVGLPNVDYFQQQEDSLTLDMLNYLDDKRRAKDSRNFAGLIDDIPLDVDAPVGYRTQKMHQRRRRLAKKSDLSDVEMSDDDNDNAVNIDIAFGDGSLDVEEEIERDRAKIETAAYNLILVKKTVVVKRTEEVNESGDAVVEGQTAPDKTAAADAEDDMEYISGDMLGATDKQRKFREITEKKLMWRVRGMRTPLRELLSALLP